LAREGVGAGPSYPSISMWTTSLDDPILLREGMKVLNDWIAEFQRVSPRYVCTAHIPLLDVEDGVAEIERVAAMGFKAGFFPVAPPPAQPPFVSDAWEPVWSALEAAGIVMSIHIG